MSSSSGFNKFRIANDSRKVVKRPRPSLACTACRKQKLRCDHGNPCGSCVKKNQPEKCSYDPYNSGSLHGLADERLAHLEEMVLKLMQQQRSPGGQYQQPNPVHGEDARLHGDHTPLVLTEEDSYVGKTHWSAMLDDIHELKAAIDLAKEDSPETDATLVNESVGEVIYGMPEDYHFVQIIQQYLPPKADIDVLLSAFFSGESFIVPVAHASEFRRLTAKHLAPDQHPNPLYLSMLFSICYMGASSVSTIACSTSNENLHKAAGQCLVLGQYQKPQRYVVEALMLYAQSKNFRGLDTSRECSTILSMAVRHALAMGYHRDPDALGGFTVFEGEMRRRTWAACKQLDLMLSFQLGLPSLIRLENCDTKSPRNLLDTDFNENSAVLPPGRSEEEATNILWFIVKDRQMITFSKICQDSLSFRPVSQTEILRLDSEIEAMYSTCPDVLRPRNLSMSAMQSSFLWITGVFIEFIYLKSLCVLHRKNMSRDFQYSIESATSAATRIIQRFLSIYKEVRPGGLLQDCQWMINTFTMNDFLLGVTTLCLSLHVRSRACAPGRQTTSEGGDLDLSLELLRQSLALCDDKSDVSRDASRVANAVRIFLKRYDAHIQRVQDGSVLQSPEGVPILTSNGASIAYNFTRFDPDYSWAMDANFATLDPFKFINDPAPVGTDWNVLGLDNESGSVLAPDSYD